MTTICFHQPNKLGSLPVIAALPWIKIEVCGNRVRIVDALFYQQGKFSYTGKVVGLWNIPRIACWACIKMAAEQFVD